MTYLPISSPETTLSFTLKVLLMVLTLSGVCASVYKINSQSFESTESKIANYISLSVYVYFSVSISSLVDQLLSMPKDVLIGICGALFLFSLAERIVAAISWAVALPLAAPTDFITQQIIKRSPKNREQVRQEEILSEEDIRITAVHEAGHALLYGALEAIPPSLFAYINKRALCDAKSLSFSLGGMVGVESKLHSFQYQSFLEWGMLLSLAGMEAEKALLGDRSSGGQGDMDHWHTKAQLYLACGHSNLVYFRFPEKGWEIETNKRSLAMLIENQRMVLEKFFATNRSVLIELSDALIQQESMNQSDLKPFLEKVVSVDGIPKGEEKYLRFV